MTARTENARNFVILHLRGASIGVSREHRCLPDIIKAQIQEHNTLQPDSRARVGAHPVPERFDVRLETVADFDPLTFDDFRHQLRIVASLRSGTDFFFRCLSEIKSNRITPGSNEIHK